MKRSPIRPSPNTLSQNLDLHEGTIAGLRPSELLSAVFSVANRASRLLGTVPRRPDRRHLRIRHRNQTSRFLLFSKRKHVIVPVGNLKVSGGFAVKFLRRFFIRLSNFATGRGADQRLQEEIAGHLAFQTEENVRAGMS